MLAHADETEVNADDFYAPAPVTPAFGAVRPVPTVSTLSSVPQVRRASRWPWVALGVALVALFVGLAVVLWPNASPRSGPDLSMARLFGQQTRAQLPQPVTTEDCAAAVRAFPKVAADPQARAAFIDGCTHGG
jgi:hypothetical protein